MIKRYLFLIILIFVASVPLAPLYANYIPDGEEWAWMSDGCSDGQGTCPNCSATCSVNRNSGVCSSCGWEYGNGESIGTEVDLPVGEGMGLLLVGAWCYTLYVRVQQKRKTKRETTNSEI